MTASADTPVARKRNALVSTKPVKYTDGVSTWEALPGQPNGTFYIPGFPEEMYSLKSLHDWIRKNCRRAKLVSGQDIEDLGEPTIQDALCLTGEVPQRNKSSDTPNKSVKGKGKAAENRQSIVNWFLNTHPSGSATKKAICDGTGLSTPTVNALVANMPELEVAGKEGNFNLYRLKTK